MGRMHFTLLKRERDGEVSVALLAGAMRGVMHDSCSHKHKYVRTSHGMGSESLSRGVALFFAQEFCSFKQEHGSPSGSKQAKTDVLLTTVLGPLLCGQVMLHPVAAAAAIGLFSRSAR